MPPELLIDYLGKCRAGRQVPFLVLFHCAPVLKGIKASNMITLPKGAWLQVAGYLKGTKVDWHILSSGTRADVLLLYRKEWLEKLLADSRNRAFLEERGYRVKEGDTPVKVCELLEMVRDRYGSYRDSRRGFPHELGILLQYPLEDVMAFIEHGGEDYLMNGYWKVYHDPARAKEIFRRYNRVRETASREFMEGRSWKEIIV